MTTYFYNTVTEAVIDYNQLKALFNSGFSWPVNDNGTSVDARLLMDNIHPDILQYKRLFLTPEPVPEKIWEIVDPFTVVYNSGNSRYEQSWLIRSRTGPEMTEVNLTVQNHLEDLRYLELVKPVEYNGLFADSLPDTQTALARVMNSIMSNMNISEIAWEGSPDNDSLNRWKIATVPDLQNLTDLTFEIEQTAYFSKKFVMEQQLNTSYDTLEDVTNAFNEQMTGS